MRAKLLRALVAPVALTALFALPAFAEEGPVAPAVEEAAPASVENPVDISLRLKAGEAYHYRQTKTMSQQSAMGGMDMEDVQDIKISVASVQEDGSYTLEVEIGRIRGSMTGAMFGTLPYDSHKPSAGLGNPMLDVFVEAATAMAGRKLTMTINEQGRISKVTGTEGIIDGLMEKHPGGAMMRPMIASRFTEDAMKSEFHNLLAAVPKHPVGVGSQWKHDEPLAGMTGLKAKSIYEFTLSAADDQEIVIESTGTIEATVDPNAGMAAMQLQGFKMSESSVKGKSRYLASSGMPAGSEGASKMRFMTSMGETSVDTKFLLERRETTEPATKPAEEKPATDGATSDEPAPVPPVSDE